MLSSEHEFLYVEMFSSPVTGMQIVYTIPRALRSLLTLLPVVGMEFSAIYWIIQRFMEII
jgi:hypothetical protein